MVQAVLGEHAGARVQAVGVVAVVRLLGVMTLQALTRLAGAVDRGALGRPRALVLDFTHSVVACTAWELAVLPAGQGGVRDVPAVFVARGAAHDVFRLHALRCEALGCHRRVTTDLAAAVAWATAAATQATG